MSIDERGPRFGTEAATARALESGRRREAERQWSRRVRRIGGMIQVAFAAFWLVRGSLAVGGLIGTLLAVVLFLACTATIGYAVTATRAKAPRPSGRRALSIERNVTIATIVQLVASFAVPVAVGVAGYGDWVLPSIAMTIGLLLLDLDYLVHLPRYRWAGGALVLGPIMCAVVFSGDAITVAMGLGAGAILLVIAGAGFRDLAMLPIPAATTVARR